MKQNKSTPDFGKNTPIPAMDPKLWQNKATAFVIRSHRHLWGKNNEDPHIYLYQKGLKNDFIKKMMIGWNKHGQNRLASAWGIRCVSENKNLFLPSGIVIPCIVDKQLSGMFIRPWEETKPWERVPGSPGQILYLKGKNSQHLVVVDDLFDALNLFQETDQAVSVAGVPWRSQKTDNLIDQALSAAVKILKFSDHLDTCIDQSVQQVSMTDRPTLENKLSEIKSFFTMGSHKKQK